MSDGLASAAKLLAEPARAAMLLELMSGRSLPAGELAAAANVSAQTASEHLARLAEGGFVTAYRQGRHRYFGLAAPEVADVVESLLVLTAGVMKCEDAAGVPELGTLQHARTCYSHLAGWLGVRIADALQQRDYLHATQQRAFTLTESGRSWFESIGVPVLRPSGSADPKLARQCIDWTQRRPHLAGKLGVAMYKQFVAHRWIIPARTSRAVRLTLEGRQALQKQLGITAG